ncbi:hypothetical protein H072_10306 [Dactylellina haptotyla CBS 200.50]|uniref:Uncharacterized protein n=1 Tax=Dactylellina haptotyla (strain CBS 200.50) TaxID=1284197 RepID=S8BLT4_DACHA|nr:hypothetical protein H072_10306 [Dactylellina haptotyla CBS 200.50]
MSDAAFPKLKPAFSLMLSIDPGKPIGMKLAQQILDSLESRSETIRESGLSSGPKLVWVNIKSGTLKSHTDYPVKVNAELISGADWIHGDPSGEIQRLDVRSVFKTDDDALLNFSYLGLIHMDKDIASIFGETASPGLVTDWKAVTHKFIQAGSEKYKQLENEVFVAVGRFHVNEGEVLVEYNISAVVA